MCNFDMNQLPLFPTHPPPTPPAGIMLLFSGFSERKPDTPSIGQQTIDSSQSRTEHLQSATSGNKLGILMDFIHMEVGEGLIIRADPSSMQATPSRCA